MIDFTNPYKLLKIFAILSLVQYVLSSCSQTTTAKSTDYSISDWSGSTWTFASFDVGVTSGDFYHLLSSSTDNQCAIIREKSNGTQVWAKLYNTGKQCSTVKIDPTETKAYLASDESVFNLGVANCSNGALDTFGEINDATYTTSGGKVGIAITPDGSNLIFTDGSQTSSNYGFVCNCDISSLLCS